MPNTTVDREYEYADARLSFLEMAFLVREQPAASRTPPRPLDRHPRRRRTAESPPALRQVHPRRHARGRPRSRSAWPAYLLLVPARRDPDACRHRNQDWRCERVLRKKRCSLFRPGKKLIRILFHKRVNDPDIVGPAHLDLGARPLVDDVADVLPGLIVLVKDDPVVVVDEVRH